MKDNLSKQDSLVSSLCKRGLTPFQTLDDEEFKKILDQRTRTGRFNNDLYDQLVSQI